MKKLLFILAMFCNISLFAQFDTAPILAAIETEAASNTTQHSSTQNQITTLQNKLSDKLDEQNDLLEKLLKIKQREEDDLLNVPFYIQKGNSLNTIRSSELNILKLVQKLESVVSSMNGIDVSKVLKHLLNRLQNDVLLSETITSNNVLRMSPQERASSLKEIENSVIKLEMNLQSFIVSLESLKRSNYSREEKQSQFENLMNAKMVALFNN